MNQDVEGVGKPMGRRMWRAGKVILHSPNIGKGQLNVNFSIVSTKVAKDMIRIL